MKEFLVPEVMVVRFNHDDILSTSCPGADCYCVYCPDCHEGDDCRKICEFV